MVKGRHAKGSAPHHRAKPSKTLPITAGTFMKIHVNQLFTITCQQISRHAVVPSRPMFRRLCLLLLLCSNAYAAPSPEVERAAATPAASIDRSLLVQLQDVQHNVADRTSSLISTAMGFIGVPYRRGGSSAETGFDCSGFVQVVFKIVGYQLQRDASQQARQGRDVESFSSARGGDLAFFKNDEDRITHVGIYIGNGKIIHASGRVRIDTLTEEGIVQSESNQMTHRFSHFRRFLTEAQ